MPEETNGAVMQSEGQGIIEQVFAKQAYKPSRSECLREFRVQIEFLSIGCVIHVGCKSIPFSTIAEGMKALNDYVASPYEVREVWEDKLSKEEL